MARGKHSAKQPSLSRVDRHFATVANRYARDVVSGKILAGKWTRAACKRHLDDLVKSASAEFAYKFSARHAGRVCRFIEQLPHVKGEWARIDSANSGLI